MNQVLYDSYKCGFRKRIQSAAFFRRKLLAMRLSDEEYQHFFQAYIDVKRAALGEAVRMQEERTR